MYIGLLETILGHTSMQHKIIWNNYHIYENNYSSPLEFWFPLHQRKPSNLTAKQQPTNR